MIVLLSLGFVAPRVVAKKSERHAAAKQADHAADVTGRTHLACKGLIKICIKAHRTMIIEHPIPVSGYPSFPPP